LEKTPLPALLPVFSGDELEFQKALAETPPKASTVGM